MAALVGVVPVATIAQDVPTRQLTFASWNVADPRAREALGLPKEEPSKPAWRTSFGSERRNTESASATPRTPIVADIILLQGVTSVQAVRRHFPARDWRLVVSRRILNSGDGVQAPAILVRSTPDLRVTAVDQRVAVPDSAADGPAHAAVDGIAAVAVKVGTGARSVWAVSLQRETPCADAKDSCPMLAELARWREGHRAAGEGVVVGGSPWDRDELPLPPPPCPDQALIFEQGPAGPERNRASAMDDPILGCVAGLAVTP